MMTVTVMSLSRFDIAFLPRGKCLLISWLQSLFAVILEPKKIKSVTVSTISPSICHGVMGLDAILLVFGMLSFFLFFLFFLFFFFNFLNFKIFNSYMRSQT